MEIEMEAEIEMKTKTKTKTEMEMEMEMEMELKAKPEEAKPKVNPKPRSGAPAAKIYGYIRVSGGAETGPAEGVQLAALRESGAAAADIFRDRPSAGQDGRPAYETLLKLLRPGDTVVVKSLDRLGGDYTEIIREWNRLTRELRVHIRVTDMPFLDTRGQLRDFRGSGPLAAGIVLEVLGRAAEAERAARRARQAAGVEAARARGAKFGRPRKAQPEGFAALLEQWRAGSISARSAAGRMGVNHKTFLAWAADAQPLCSDLGAPPQTPARAFSP
jgi:DNA invertase Pin-like site-specific DNA recombinase